jgi:hypothetical protein
MIRLKKFLPLVVQLGAYLKVGIDHYADLRSAGKEANTEIVAVFLRMKMSDWNPTLNEKEILDEETRAAAARFLAGVAVNFAGA